MIPITSLNQLPTQSINSCYFSDSSDSEINSCGETEDMGFEVYSLSTEEEQEPCPIKDIIDCCTYSNEIVYLHSTYITCYQNNRYRTVKCNRKLKSIVSYQGYLYGLDKHHLYILCNDYFFENYWIWKKVSWAPKHIIYINATLNREFLYIQTKECCYLYHDSDCKKMKVKGKRIYGIDENSYIDIINHKAYAYVDNELVKKFHHIIDAAMNYNHDIYVVRPNEGYNKVKIINYSAYYF